MTAGPTLQGLGTEHAYYDRRPLVAREPLRWPGGEPLAIAVLVCAEYYELRPRANAYAPVNVPGMFGRGPYPDFGSFSRREYGNRVGIFRVMQALDEQGLAATAAIDACVARHCPGLVEEVLRRGWPVAGHGHSANDVISSLMSESEERAYIAASLATLSQATGRAIAGWHGAEYAESARTPDLLAEAGIRYLMDWPNDEQPYFMSPDGGRLVSLPVAADFDDVNAMWHRRISPERWSAAILDGVDRLLIDGEQSARLFILNLHPWFVGQPFRTYALRRLLAALRSRSGIWFTTTEEIALWFRSRAPAAPAAAIASGAKDA